MTSKLLQIISGNRLYGLIFIFTLILISANLQAQKRTRVILKQADDLLIDKKFGPNVQRLLGNVILKHDSTWFYCDSAYLNNKANTFDAYGHVHINVNDTLDIFGDSLNYDGKTRIGEIHENVRLIDKKATLTTDHLKFNRKTGIAYYHTGGTIVSEDNTLTSRIGYYYTWTEQFFFKEDVVLVNPDYVMNSDTLVYHTITEIAFFHGPTTIVGEEDHIYTEKGWYNTDIDKAHLTKNPTLTHNEQIIEGDSIYYDGASEFGEAFSNVVLTDTLQDVIVMGHYAQFDRQVGYAYVTDSTVAIMIDRTDSLFLHADTLKIFTDSTGQAEKMHAYYKVKFFREDLQGMCDSLTYTIADSTLSLYKDPVLWSDQNQLTSDSIKIVYANKEIDSLVLYSNCFIASQDDSTTFNQIKGKNMVGYFSSNGLYKITVSGNSQTIYFVREENGTLIGINKVTSSKMLIFIEDNDLKTITYIDMPKATLYPEEEVPENELRLKGFKWIEGRRPLSKHDIFVW